ncbi:hypothetical protein PAXINDRAFT_103396 [Paxillus involutus ATCC 200175]|uniref:Uncharacterized protein n=1 Tax=Paxillus involutus ATCC 200175 TaxID=664439 RepID=A0A0C9TDT4_PAXIN|nr:hypothetical protein PAXINDRAFT_103396 [Paxillus involutus ATCC 200175]
MSQIKSLTGQSALAFLLTHDPEDAHHFGFHIPLKSKRDSSYAAFAEADLVNDQVAYLTVKTTNTNPLEQEITVKIPDLKLTFTHTGSFQYIHPDPEHANPIENSVDVKGQMYLRGDASIVGEAGYNCQQFPRYDGTGNNGRISIDFWNSQEVTGVFRTDLDNYTYGGNTGGKWAKDL